MPIRESAEQRLRELNAAELSIARAVPFLDAFNRAHPDSIGLDWVYWIGKAWKEADSRREETRVLETDPKWIRSLLELIARERMRVLLLGEFQLPFWVEALEPSKDANSPRIPRDAVALAQEFEERIKDRPEMLTWKEAAFAWESSEAKQRTWGDEKIAANEVAASVCTLWASGDLWPTSSLRASREDAARKRLADHLRRVPKFSETLAANQTMTLREALALAALARAEDGRSTSR